MEDPKVSINGRTVTVKFELQFVAGDPCITPYQAERTTVSRIPDICIMLEENLQRARVSNGGAWYSHSHSQMHGVEQYLPDMDAFLAYWLRRGDDEAFGDRVQWLQKVFSDTPDAIAALQRRLIEGRQNAIQALTKEMTSAALEHTQKIAALQKKLQQLKDPS